ncbi:DUF456 domain-containing protein [Bacillus fonticola]|uniref:DUF456 domain-containing protein n=1 Tax=Bacillus fonticola TaxID=2728853 RepID=UPI001474FB35|nr:DUF456 family protein [Bacillus fonticola]
MSIIGWALVVLLLILSFVGIVYPIIPSAVVLIAAYVVYGLFFSFDALTWTFWVWQGILLALLFVADYVATALGVTRLGGSNAGVWGSTVGILVGPFVLPFAGLILGPFLGAMIAELIVHKRSLKDAAKIGFGSFLGFLGSSVTKALLQVVMIVIFFVYVS